MREEGVSMAEEVEWFVGIDWASQSHQVCLVDARGECLGERASRGKPGFVSHEDKVPGETDSPVEGDGFEPSVPRKAPDTDAFKRRCSAPVCGCRACSLGASNDVRPLPRRGARRARRPAMRANCRLRLLRI